MATDIKGVMRFDCIDSEGYCPQCKKTWSGTNSVPMALKHTNSTGHKTTVKVTNSIIFEQEES